jgi:tetratricopeptide (TPR) repeat protein
MTDPLTHSTAPELADAWTALREGRLEEAERLFLGHTGGPHAAEAYHGRGLAAAQQGDLARAGELFEEAARRDGEHALYRFQHGVTMLAQGRFEAAERAFREAVRIDAAFQQAWFNLAASLERLGRGEEALAAYRRCGESLPEGTLAASRMLRGLRRLDEALAAAEAAAEKWPSRPDAQLERGTCLAESGRLEDAIAAWRTAAEIDPKSPDPRFRIGVALALLGRLDAAEEAYTGVLAEHPKHVASMVNLAALLMRQDRLDEASRHLKTALDLRPPETPIILRAIGDLQIRNRNPAAAEAAYREASRLAPHDLAARIGRGESLRLLGRLDEAIRELRAVTDQAPEVEGATEALALAMHQAGRSLDARSLLTGTLARRGDHAGLLAVLAAIAIDGGDTGEARGLLDRAIAANPDDPRPRALLEKLDAA